VTDAPSRQGTPEDEDGQPSAGGEQPGTQMQKTQDAAESPQWSAEQPAPAPWFLGQPGAAPPAGWPPVPVPPMPPPTQDQASWPYQAPGTRPEQAGQSAQPGQSGQDQGAAGQAQGQGQGQAPAQGQQGQGQTGAWPGGGAVPPWTGQAPPNPEHPYPNAGPGSGPGQQPPAPWLDPSRYSQQPGGRPPRQDQRQPYRPPQQQRREEPGTRPPLGLQTRWARGLAMGGAACTLLTLLTGYHNFPSWLIGATVGLLMSLGGLWLGVFAQRAALSRRQRAPEAVAAVVWSSISTLITVGIVAFSLIFYPQLHQYSECMRSAKTIASQNACQQQLNNSRTFTP